jgi:hypothetical protein
MVDREDPLLNYSDVLNSSTSLSMYLLCNSRIHVITLYSGHVCVYYASMLQCWHLVWILVRTDHPCLGVGCHIEPIPSSLQQHIKQKPSSSSPTINTSHHSPTLITSSLPYSIGQVAASTPDSSTLLRHDVDESLLKLPPGVDAEHAPTGCPSLTSISLQPRPAVHVCYQSMPSIQIELFEHT